MAGYLGKLSGAPRAGRVAVGQAKYDGLGRGKTRRQKQEAQKPEARSQKQEGQKPEARSKNTVVQLNRHSFWLLTSDSRPFWLLASDSRGRTTGIETNPHMNIHRYKLLDSLSGAR
jgi:hypothetical protein